MKSSLVKRTAIKLLADKMSSYDKYYNMKIGGPSSWRSTRSAGTANTTVTMPLHGATATTGSDYKVTVNASDDPHFIQVGKKHYWFDPQNKVLIESETQGPDGTIPVQSTEPAQIADTLEGALTRFYERQVIELEKTIKLKDKLLAELNAEASERQRREQQIVKTHIEEIALYERKITELKTVIDRAGGRRWEPQEETEATPSTKTVRVVKIGE